MNKRHCEALLNAGTRLRILANDGRRLVLEAAAQYRPSTC